MTLETANPTYGLSLPTLHQWNVSVYKPAPPPPPSAPAPMAAVAAMPLLRRSARRSAPADFAEESFGGPAMDYATSRVESKGSMSATFRVPGLVTIPSDGGERSFTIVELELNALMTWFSIPNIDTRVHLKVCQEASRRKSRTLTYFIRPKFTTNQSIRYCQEEQAFMLTGVLYPSRIYRQLVPLKSSTVHLGTFAP